MITTIVEDKDVRLSKIENQILLFIEEQRYLRFIRSTQVRNPVTVALKWITNAFHFT